MPPTSHAWTRRALLLTFSGTVLSRSAWAGLPGGTRFAAAWQQGSQHFIGLLAVADGQLEPTMSLPLPTRAHGVLLEPDGSLLAFARRPGDWLLRWHPPTGSTQWHWLENDRRLNGHGVQVGDELLVTTETDQETGQGWLGVRDRASLKLVDAWPTHGLDPHQVLVLPHRLGPWPSGTLMVANGGVRTRPESGRSKTYGERLDASLVALNPRDGRLLGQWRLRDPYLSTRHLAVDVKAQTLGIALQAEHFTEAERIHAPVLAVWDGDQLTVTDNPPALGGYGGDIVTRSLGQEGGFAVACTRGDAVALYAGDGRFIRKVAHPQACALTRTGCAWWGAGRDSVLSERSNSSTTVSSNWERLHKASGLQIDNHWQLYSG